MLHALAHHVKIAVTAKAAEVTNRYIVKIAALRITARVIITYK